MHEMLECASMHSRTLNASTIISPQMHFHYWQTDTSPFAMYSVRLRFTLEQMRKKKKNPLCAVRKILEWIFKCSSSNTMAHGYGAVECCRSLDVSKCDSKPIHTIFNDFDSNKCDLKKKKVSETKISFSLTLAVCLMD